MVALANATEFMLSEATPGEYHSQADKDLIATFAKSFRQQRKIVCDRHQDWFVYDVEDVNGGPEFKEKTPEPCK